MAQENMLANNAGQIANFTTTAFLYNSRLVVRSDTVPPSAPARLAGTAGYSSASLSWTGATDDIGVAGY